MPSKDNFYFLDESSDLSADEYLKQRIGMLREQFSYEELSGLPPEGLECQAEKFVEELNDIHYQFEPDREISQEERTEWEWIRDERWDFYPSLAESQRKELEVLQNEIKRNFEKAGEDARDRGVSRLTQLLSAIPVIGG